MADFLLDRLKFRWRGEWSSSVSYRKDDIVYYKGKAYVCKAAHTPSSNFYEDRDASITDETITVTVSTDTITGESHGHFYLNGLENPTLIMLKGRTYTLIQDSDTNVEFNSEIHPLILSLTKDGILNGGSYYLENVEYSLDGAPVSVENYILGFSSATVRRIEITPSSNITSRLYYASSNNLGMGNYFDTQYDTYWENMFDGYSWKGDWSTSTFYSEGDIVKFKGYLYQALEQHNSLAVSGIGLPGDSAKWILYATGVNWLNTWSTSTNYDLGDVVRYNGSVYICKTKHFSNADSSNGLEVDNLKWDLINRSQYWTGDWQTSTRYIVDDIVKYGGIVYRCQAEHTSAADNSLGLEDNIGAWEVISSGIEYKGNWTGVTRYKLNDVVKYGGALWKANNPHTSTSSLRSDLSNWDIYIPGVEYELNWNSVTEYNKGDVVRYGGYTYTALTNNASSQPSVNGLLQDTGDWELLNQSYRFLQDWDNTVNYRPGDVVRHGGHLYVSLLDNFAIIPDTDQNNWYLLVDGREFKGDWQDNFEYKLGDVVLYAGTTYQCIARHTSTASDSRPDLDIQQDDQDYWIVLIQGSSNSVMAERGDLRVHDGTEVVRQPIGNPGRVAKTSITGDFSWGTYEEIPQIYYVSVNGFDSTDNGKSLGAPFRTVKYACDYIKDNLGINKINLQKYNNDSGTEVITMLSTVLLQNFAGTLSATAPNLDAALEVINPRTGNPYGDIDGNGNIGLFDALDGAQGTLGTPALNEAEALAFNELVDYLNSRADDFVNETTANISGYTPGTIPITIATYPNTTVFIKTGLYEEILPISVPQNCALVGDELRSTTITPANGYTTSNMFYVNNGSGIRNMTLQGLNGTLGEQNIYLTKRPSAGAYVSLDPGTGTDDESVWITNKSPYIQNVTTFGTGCIGMKIDGSLHDGGNDSIVANDFTQVLDDGIGYWAINGGRSELVSVFTYFCHIGYLAENGGILRATNGNNSYGEYGSVAEGVDTTETPITATINNRNSEALVNEIFTYGTVQQRILALGYDHAGENYTSATVSFAGSGINASGSYTEIRKNAVSNVRIEALGDSSVPGGLNYTFASNNAQSGTATTIRLAGSDIASDLEYIGQRVVITSGLGVGQYAEITDYNSITKVAIVSRESDGSNGWDHFQPGWPIENTLDETTVYTIEPKITITEPNFSSTTLSSPDALNWQFIATDGSDNLVAITDSGSANYAVSTNGGASWSSASFPAWTGTPSLVGVVYTGQNWIVASDTEYARGSNPSSLSTRTATASNIVSIATNGNGGVIFVLDNGDIEYSTDHGSSRLTSTGIVGKAAYGGGKYVIIANNGNVAYSEDNGATWTTTTSAVNTRTWNEIIYGNSRFVAISETGNFVTRSFDGINWYENHIEDISETLNRVSYGAGVFLASGGTTHVALSKGADVWRTFGDDSSEFTTSITGEWTGSVYSYSLDNFILMNKSLDLGAYNWNLISTGSRAVGRAKISNSRISKVLIYDPGSNYTSTPSITITDNSNTVDALLSLRVNDGVLPQPEMTNRGTGYVTATATITGDGYAEIYQTSSTLVVSDLTRLPGPGDNLSIDGINDIVYSVIRVDSSTGSGPFEATLTITPSLGVEESPAHATDIEIRQLYSQVRLTGHDFLDIGTGNVNSTRYPNLYLEGESPENARQPFNETVASGGGRVFYTSTDQDGNFRAGELFAVEQATGIVTINASQFDLTGLTELSLGGISVGGTQVVIREFSKDGSFLADSNNIVPTQAAIKTYLESRISGGGSNANTNRLVAGQIQIDTNTITTTSGLQINVNQATKIKGGVDGHYLATLYYGRS